jgi:hypothetical protein
VNLEQLQQGLRLGRCSRRPPDLSLLATVVPHQEGHVHADPVFLDVTNVDLDVAYVAMGIYTCCKRMFQVFNLDVAKVDLDVSMTIYVCCMRMFKCFRCFRRIFQVFYLDIAKVVLDVLYVAMAIHACFKRMFQVFQVLGTYVGSV